MNQGPWWQAVRIAWALLGGVWGAWLGFGGALRLPDNADTFAALFAYLFFGFFALGGLLAGALAGAAIGISAETLLRRFGAGTAITLCLATLANVLVLWQIADFIQAKYPGLRAEGPAKVQRGSSLGARYPGIAGAASPVTGITVRKTCLDPPPTQSSERASWDAECR